MDHGSTPAEAQQHELLAPITGPQELKQRLGLIKRAYKRGLFDKNLETAGRNLFAYYRKADKQDTREYWKGRTLLYELNDIFQIDSTISDGTFNDGAQVHEELRRLSIKHSGIGFVFSQRKELRERVLFVACYAHELQRRGEKRLALHTLEWLLSFVERFVEESDVMPCLTIKATLNYHVGFVQRKLEQHHSAEINYSKALDLLHDRSKSRPDDLDDYFFVIRKQAMIVGLGFGLMNLARGSLERAQHALRTARSMLARGEDPLIRPYVELYCGAIQRCRAGSDRDKLEKAIKELEHARTALEKHKRYKIRASWELALAKTLCNNFAGARADLQLVSDYAERESDQKWRANVHILQCRLLRREGRNSEALDEAALAVKIASSECKTTLPLIDALITRGEAYLAKADETDSLAHYTTALADFNQALRSIKEQETVTSATNLIPNPKIVAVCELRIAQIYARQGNQRRALAHFSEWLRLEGQVEHEWVRELATHVKDDIDNLSLNFTISATDEKAWAYTENVVKLRRWLLKRALRHTNQNYSKAAELIGVQRATLYQWLANDDHVKKRRGPSAKSTETDVPEVYTFPT